MSISTAPPWYEIVADDSLRQGDIFLGMLALWLPPGIVPPSDPPDREFKLTIAYETADWIIISASCDIDRAKEGHVLLARIFSATPENLSTKTEAQLREKLEVLKRGFDPLRYLLAQHQAKPVLPLSFVGYRTQVFLPIDYVRRFCTTSRLRMRPPHREQFGIWAGANLGRVGIEDVDQIKFEGKAPFIGPVHILRSVEPE